MWKLLIALAVGYYVVTIRLSTVRQSVHDLRIFKSRDDVGSEEQSEKKLNWNLLPLLVLFSASLWQCGRSSVEKFPSNCYSVSISFPSHRCQDLKGSEPFLRWAESEEPTPRCSLSVWFKQWEFGLFCFDLTWDSCPTPQRPPPLLPPGPKFVCRLVCFSEEPSWA